jgi:uncharacterized HAD superfamily protein
MKNKIAVDIDDVLLSFTKSFLYFCNFNYGTSFKEEDIFSYHLEESLKISNKEKDRWMSEFYSSNSFREIKPVKGAQEGLIKLNENNEIIIVTSRPSYLKLETEHSMAKHFGNLFSIIFHSENGSGVTKAEICEREGVSFLMEDCWDYAMGCNKRRIPVFLFDKPWNQKNLEGTLITRVKNWDEVLRKIGNEKIYFKD